VVVGLGASVAPAFRNFLRAPMNEVKLGRLSRPSQIIVVSFPPAFLLGAKFLGALAARASVTGCE
jgi:hypothetical protein